MTNRNDGSKGDTLVQPQNAFGGFGKDLEPYVRNGAVHPRNTNQEGFLIDRHQIGSLDPVAGPCAGTRPQVGPSQDRQ